MSRDQNERIDQLMEGQRAFLAGGGTDDAGMRIAGLRRLETSLVRRREELLGVLAVDLGKPEIEAFLAEYHFLLQEIRLVCGSLRRWMKPRRVGSPFYFLPCRSFLRRDPFGMVLVMSPWNYPIQLSLSPVIAAIAAGNTVVLKPSEMAKASERFLADILGECFPPEQVAVVTGDVEVATALLDREFDFIFFTGSTEVGRVVAGKAARFPTPTVLELGGKCPCVVDRTADIPMTASRILVGKLFNAGQTCFAPDFVMVHDSIKEEFVAELGSLLEALPWEREMATIINKGHYDRLTCLLGGREIRKSEDDPEVLHFAPRILPEVDWEDRVMKEEVFGPILPVIGYSDSGQAIARLRGFPSPLALYGFSRDEAFIRELVGNIRSGSVCINDTMKQASNLDLPFGGVGGSGHGRYRGKAGFEAFTYSRAVTKRYFLPDFFESLPPRRKMADFLMKWLK